MTIVFERRIKHIRELDDAMDVYTILVTSSLLTLKRVGEDASESASAGNK